MEMTLNTFFFESYNYAILSLCVIELLTVLMISGFQIVLKCYRNKIEFLGANQEIDRNKTF